MNSYQKIVLLFGVVLLFIMSISSGDVSHSAFPMGKLLKLLGIAVVTGLFLYAFKDLGKKRGKKGKENSSSQQKNR